MKITEFFNKTKGLSFFIFSLAITLISFSFLSKNQFPGIPFRFSEYIIKHLSFPKADLFTWVSDHVTYCCDEWLSFLLLHFVYRLSGVVGMFFLFVTISMIIFFIIMRYNRNTLGDHFIMFLILFIFAAINFSRFFAFEGIIVCCILFTLELMILYSNRTADTKSIYLIPFIACLWANTYGHFSNVSYLLCILFLIDAAIVKQKEASKSIIRLGSMVALSFIGICINPYGIKMLAYPYQHNLSSRVNQYLGSGAPDAKEFNSLLFGFIPLVLVMMLFILQRSKVEVIDFLLFGLTAFATFAHERNIIFFLIAASFYIGKYAIDFSEVSLYGKPIQITFSLKNQWTMICAVVILIVSICISFGTGYSTLKKKEFMKQPLSASAIEAIQKENPKRPYTSPILGDALIAGNIPVFTDHRSYIYQNYNLSDAENIDFLFSGFQAPKSIKSQIEVRSDLVEYYFDKYEFDGFIVYKNNSLYPYLNALPDQYTKQYDDSMIAYFKRN